MEVCVIDLGSNSFHLLHARVGEEGALERIASARAPVAIGRSVFKHGDLDTETWAQALRSAGELAEVAASASPAARRVAVGTSALREATNGPAFLRRVGEAFAISTELLSAREEAALAYRGARSELAVCDETVAVMDLGGGSLEVAVGTKDDHCEIAASVPLGVRRILEALASEPPIGARDAAAIADIVRVVAGPMAQLARATQPAHVVFSSGTALAVRDLAHAAGVIPADATRMDRAALHRAVAVSLSCSPARLRALGVKPDRVPTIAIATVVVDTLIQMMEASEVAFTSRGLREGVVLREVEQSRRAGGQCPTNANDARALRCVNPLRRATIQSDEPVRALGLKI